MLTGQYLYIINGGISIATFNNSFGQPFLITITGDYLYQLGSPDKVFPFRRGKIKFSNSQFKGKPQKYA